MPCPREITPAWQLPHGINRRATASTQAQAVVAARCLPLCCPTWHSAQPTPGDRPVRRSQQCPDCARGPLNAMRRACLIWISPPHSDAALENGGRLRFYTIIIGEITNKRYKILAHFHLLYKRTKRRHTMGCWAGVATEFVVSVTFVRGAGSSHGCVPKQVLAKLGSPKALRYVIDGDQVTVSGVAR